MEAFPSHETQRLAPGRAKSKVPRARTSRAGEGKVPGTASTHVSRRGGRSPRYREYVRYWWTYQRHRENAGTMVLTHKRVPLRTGDQPQNWPGRRYFFNFLGDLKFSQVGTVLVLEVAGWSFLGIPTWCWWSPVGLPQENPRSVGGRGVLSEYVASFRGFHSPSGCFSCRVCSRIVLGLWTCAVLKAVSHRKRKYPWSVCVAVSPVYVFVSHGADCCTRTLGDFVVICTFLLFDVFCLVECAVDSDCSCWETPGRFLHHDMGRLIGRECRTSLPPVCPPHSPFPVFASWCLFNRSVVTLHRVVSSSTAECPREQSRFSHRVVSASSVWWQRSPRSPVPLSATLCLLSVPNTLRILCAKATSLT